MWGPKRHTDGAVIPEPNSIQLTNLLCFAHVLIFRTYDLNLFLHFVLFLLRIDPRACHIRSLRFKPCRIHKFSVKLVPRQPLSWWNSCFLLNLCSVCTELGPGSAIFGFLAKNYTGYTNSCPNWRHRSLFHEQFMFFRFCSELAPGSALAPPECMYI